ncbi:Helicase associated domain protein [Streptomyces sp. NPDC050535]|uniref:DEAD/DEAH box helicase n=1 Tax=Streptomyces sp. NPDC050535 TaxID=3365626 RepID=UPI003798119E
MTRLTAPGTPRRSASGHLPSMRPYQREAHEAIITGLTTGKRGQLHAACGAGKTFMALRAVEELVPGDGLIVVLAPSLALVAQILREWQDARMVGFSAMAVCSDEKVSDAPVRTEDLEVPVSTDPAVIASWLGGGGRRVIFGTYTSADRVGEGLRLAGLEADTLVCDEGHHLFGKRDAVRRQIITDPTFLPHSRRLVMTATPNVTGWQAADSLSWRNEELFGPVLFRYPFARGIADGYLKDYRLVVLGISDAEARALLADTASDYVDGEIALRTVVAQAALAHARTAYGTERAITFHPRVQQAADFARTLPATVDRLPAAKQPAGVVDATHISGAMDTAEREDIMARLAQPPAGGWTVVSNAQCLTEGVDVPAVDTIVFTHPSRSATRVTQAVGRAMRRSRHTASIATIIVPVIVPDDTAEVDDELDAGDFEVLFEVVRALRAHDEGFAAELDRERANRSLRSAGRQDAEGPGEQDPDVPGLPKRVTFHLPEGTSDRILKQLRLLTVRNSTSSWWEGYADAVAFRNEHGHLNVPEKCPGASGRRLDAWLGTLRRHRRKGWVPQDRIDAMDRIGIEWEPMDARRQQLLSDARSYHRANGSLNVPNNHVTAEGRLLGSQFRALRLAYREGRLLQPLIDALDELGMRWDPQAAKRQELLDACDRYRQRFGNLDVPVKFIDDEGYRLGSALSYARSVAQGTVKDQDGTPRTLDADHRAELEKRGVALELRVTALSKDLKAALVEKVQAGAQLQDAREALGLSDSAVTTARQKDTQFDARLRAARQTHYRVLDASEKQALIDTVGSGTSVRQARRILGLSVSSVVTARQKDAQFDAHLKAALHEQSRPLDASEKQALIDKIGSGTSLRQACETLGIRSSPLASARRDDPDFERELVRASGGRIRPAKRQVTGSGSSPLPEESQ